MKNRIPKISIIIRTKNEERWITLCLTQVFNQTCKNIEVIIVDNQSDDYTVKLAKKFPVKIITIDKFLPGKAINDGIRASQGEYIVCLSAHCVPKHDRWLENLLRNFKNPKIAGVYGRQEPLASSSDNDKRDLILTFGLDKKIQKKDYFFHNANSMIRRNVWEQIPFSEEATNIEDRIWAKEVLKMDYFITYEPEAEVFHHHGIHHNGNEKRAKSIIKVLEKLEGEITNKNSSESLHPKNLEIVALLPVRGKSLNISNINLLKRCIDQTNEIDLVRKVYVLSDNEQERAQIQKWGAEVILRPRLLSSSQKTIEDVLRFGSLELEKKGIIPDVVIYINYLFPFRPPKLVNDLITELTNKNLDSATAGTPEYGSFWASEEEKLNRVDKGFVPREVKEPLFKGLIGLGCATLPQFVSEGRLLGDKVGIVPIIDPKYHIKIQDENDVFHQKIVKHLLSEENK